ncbi:MAG TPA: hypothetical protein VEB40_00440 [Flavipsychrobacter sp.]|nr:hypothetical protein [Flavipsychrobacter sp.]
MVADAQQDLRDPRYIYSVDGKNNEAQAIARSTSTYPRMNVLLNGKLFRNVNYSSLYFDSGLVHHERAVYFRRRDIRKFTKEPGIKMLYVVDKNDPYKTPRIK